MIILLIVVLVVMYFLFKERKERMCFGGGPYNIPCELDEKMEAKSLLEVLDNRTKKLISHLSHNFPDLYITKNLIERYNTSSIRETHPSEVEDTSYTTDKGEILSICLRDENGNFHDIDLLMYVYLHEVAHIAEDDEQHTDKFWNTYVFLMSEALKIGIYNAIDYSEKPTTYCKLVPILFNVYHEYLDYET